MSWLKNTLAKIAGKTIAKKLDLKEESKMDDSKKWWQSKTILSAIVIVLIGLYNSVGTSLAPVLGWSLPPIPEWVFALLGAMGIYSRATADKTIK